MPDHTLLLHAADFAARKHSRQRRKNADVPYVNHPLGVAQSLVAEGGVDDAKVLAAAILHDTLEDTDTSFDELEREFGREIASMVQEVSDDKHLQKAQRKQAQVAHAPSMSPGARLVKLADKLYNLRDLARLPPANWDAARVRGYFCWAHAVVEAIGPINDGLWRALQELFASTLSLGGERCRAVPAETERREMLLAAYYQEMARKDD